ncbi:MAG: heme-binding protein [Nitrososphaeraceae archaeon]
MDISYDQAQKMLLAAVDNANSIKVPMCIAIVDGGGHLIAFTRLVLRL